MSKKKETIDEIIENWKKQLRKGTLELAILSFIKKSDSDSYGYLLIKTFNDSGIATDGSTIYPLLRRLNKKGLIKVIKKKVETEKEKNYFKITEIGIKVLEELKSEWSTYFSNINHFIKNGGS